MIPHARGEFVLSLDFDALAQQLAASQDELVQATALAMQQAQRITRLEARISKAVDLDYQRRQEIAEAVGLLRKTWNIDPTAYDEDDLHDRVNAYLAAHEEKAND